MSGRVGVRSLTKMRKRPSRDQSVGTARLGHSSSNCSVPLPVAGLTQMPYFPLRTEVNAMRLPSGDQTGFPLLAGPKVKRDSVLRARSYIQRSVVAVWGL